MEQLSNQWYSIMKKHLLLDLELEELSRMAELCDTAQEELDNRSEWPAEASNVLVNESPCLPRTFQLTFRPFGKKSMAHLPTEQG